MILRQYLHTDPVIAASYLFGCGGKAVGAVVDPIEVIDPYLRESEALGLTDRTRSDVPWFVTTGHTLTVGDMGRTDVASSAEARARALFRSAERLRALPDYVEVLPVTFSGSVCGRGLSGKVV